VLLDELHGAATIPPSHCNSVWLGAPVDIQAESFIGSNACTRLKMRLEISIGVEKGSLVLTLDRRESGAN
jgi:hypothetical protein